MGDRGHLLRALSAAAVATVCGGCLDFVEPELPERGAPAVAQISVVVSDSGTLAVTGTLAPGFDEDGLRREIFDPAIAAGGHIFLPVDTTADGALRYAASRTLEGGESLEGVLIRAPWLAAQAGAPTVFWESLRSLDADTVEREPDGSVRLNVTTVAPGAAPEPVPDVRQWFLTLAGEENVFRLSSDGPPPEVLEVPARWVPAGRVSARLIYQQSGSVQLDASYIGLITLDQRVHWTIPPGGPT